MQSYSNLLANRIDFIIQRLEIWSEKGKKKKQIPKTTQMETTKLVGKKRTWSDSPVPKEVAKTKKWKMSEESEI